MNLLQHNSLYEFTVYVVLMHLVCLLYMYVDTKM